MKLAYISTDKSSHRVSNKYYGPVKLCRVLLVLYFVACVIGQRNMATLTESVVARTLARSCNSFVE